MKQLPYRRIAIFAWIIIHSPIMRINQRKGQSFPRRSLQEHQLCRILAAYPTRRSMHKVQNQSDDQCLSRVPHAKQSQPTPIKILKEEGQQNSRRERIKMRIKSKVREEIHMIASRHYYRKCDELDAHNKSQLPRPAKSEFSLVQQSSKQSQLQQILSNCVIQHIALHQKVHPRRTAATRIRVLNSVLEMRAEAKSAIQHHSPRSKKSKPQIQRSPEQNQELQPWRYAEEGVDEGPFRRQLYF